MRNKEEIESRIKSIEKRVEKCREDKDFYAYLIELSKIEALNWVLERERSIIL